MSNAQLYRCEQQRANKGILIIWIACMHHTAQNSPNDDIPTCNNLRTMIHITHDDYMTGMVDSLARTHSTPYEEGIVRISRIKLIGLRLWLFARYLCSKRWINTNGGRGGDLAFVVYCGR